MGIFRRKGDTYKTQDGTSPSDCELLVSVYRRKIRNGVGGRWQYASDSALTFLLGTVASAATECFEQLDRVVLVDVVEKSTSHLLMRFLDSEAEDSSLEQLLTSNQFAEALGLTARFVMAEGITPEVVVLGSSLLDS